MKSLLQRFGLPALTLLTFFLLLGNRPLNEPDEGRYSEIAREMIETGNWLVPHLWYLPHLDKPPLIYWLVALSMRVFGQNEWAARLPVALAGLSGVWAAFALGCALGGKRVGLWSVLILQSAVFYWAMSRMLTPDIFLTQFTAWAMCFLWRSWTELGKSSSRFFAWHLAAWICIALAFLCKGPIALAIPVVSLLALVIARRAKVPGIFFMGLLAGFVLFLAVAVPWFLIVFQKVPLSAHYMIFGQAAGHFLGTTIKDRKGIPFYFFGVLACGFLPWTILLGWLWRRAHWRSLTPQAREGWLLLNVWAIFTFTLFSFSHAKLPAYILPIFPALAVMLAWRFFGDDPAKDSVPRWAWQIIVAFCFVAPIIFPFFVYFLLHGQTSWWLACQTPIALALLVLVIVLSRKWDRATIAACIAGLALLSLFATIAEFPLFEFDFKANQPLNQMGLALRENFRPGDTLVCWHEFPQGLPFYTGNLISATNRPYFGNMPLNKVPFEFPGNLHRLGSLYLDENGLLKLLQDDHETFIVDFGNTMESFQTNHLDLPLRLITRSGKWSLYRCDRMNRPPNGGNP